MKISLVCIGKTNETYIQEGMDVYVKRIQRYTTFNQHFTSDLKKVFTREQQKIEEGQIILKKIAQNDFLVLLDENGKEFGSVKFADYIEKHLMQSTKNLIFVIGGPYGFSDEVYARANFKLSLSQMTFSHQLIRLIFVEQLYRAFTIMKGEPYHHV
jgi:23S rRNA (pseudouridine1915-N3)-methyltransferase